MADWGTSFAEGFARGNTMREQRLGRELRERQVQSLEEHRKFAQGLNERKFALQQKQADLNLMDRVRQVLTEPTLHPEAKSFLLDDIARSRGQDPNGAYFKGLKKVIIKMPVDQAKALTNALIGAYPQLPPGGVGQMVDGLLTGGIPLADIPKLVGQLNAARQSADDAATASGIFGDEAPAPAAESSLPGGEVPLLDEDALIDEGPLPSGVQGSTDATVSIAAGPSVSGAPVTGETEFAESPGAGAAPSVATPQIQGQLSGMSEHLKSASGELDSDEQTLGQLFSGGQTGQPVNATPSAAMLRASRGGAPTAQPMPSTARAPSSDGALAGTPLTERGSRGHRYAELSRRFEEAGDHATARRYRVAAAKLGVVRNRDNWDRPRSQTSTEEAEVLLEAGNQAGAEIFSQDAERFRTRDEARASREEALRLADAEALSPTEGAPVDPKQTPEFWLKAAGEFDKRGPRFKAYADQARKQAKALSEQGGRQASVRSDRAKLTDAQNEATARAESAISGIDETLNIVNDLRTHPGLYEAVPAPLGGELSFPLLGTKLTYADIFPGSRGAEFFNKHKTLISQVVLNTMRELKALSSQGATGFGALSEKELKVLEDSAGALQLSNSPYALVEEYDNFRDKLLNARKSLIRNYKKRYNARLAVGAPPAVRRVRKVIVNGKSMPHPDYEPDSYKTAP